MNKNGQVTGAIIGAFAALISLVVILVVSGLINTVSADVVQDQTDDYVTNTANCGRNSTGGTGGTIAYTACSRAYLIGNETLKNQLQLSTRSETFTSSSLGLLLISAIVMVVGGFIGSKAL